MHMLCSVLESDIANYHVVDTLCFVVKAKLLCLGFKKRTQLEISG